MPDPISSVFQAWNATCDGRLAEILTELRDEGLSPRRISARLREDHTILVSHPTIAAWLAQLDEEAAA